MFKRWNSAYPLAYLCNTMTSKWRLTNQRFCLGHLSQSFVMIFIGITKIKTVYLLAIYKVYLMLLECCVLLKCTYILIECTNFRITSLSSRWGRIFSFRTQSNDVIMAPAKARTLRQRLLFPFLTSSQTFKCKSSSTSFSNKQWKVRNKL